MKKHTKIYLKSMGYDETGSWIACEMPGCGRACVDINHIEPRGMGGSKAKDTPENLIGLCREHHIEYEGREKEYQKSIHLKNLREAGYKL